MFPIQAVTQVHHHHQVPVPVPLPMGAPVQVSLILTDKKDHCHLARNGECPALLQLFCIGEMWEP